MTTNTTFNKDAEERLNDPADQPNTRANVCQETRKALLAATPERFAAGGRAVKLSEAARLMRSLNALPFHDIEPTIRAAEITEQEALSGCDELSAALGGVLHAAAKRTIELPEWSAGQFARLCSSADCTQKSSAEPAVSGASLTVAGNIDIEGLTNCLSSPVCVLLPQSKAFWKAAPSFLPLRMPESSLGSFRLMRRAAPLWAGIRSTRSMGNGAPEALPQLQQTSWLQAPLPAHSS